MLLLSPPVRVGFDPHLSLLKPTSESGAAVEESFLSVQVSVTDSGVSPLLGLALQSSVACGWVAVVPSVLVMCASWSLGASWSVPSALPCAIAFDTPGLRFTSTAPADHALARAGGVVDARGERHGLARRRAVRGRQRQRDGGVRDVARVAGVIGDLHRVGARVAVADGGPVLGEREIERVGVTSRRGLVRDRRRYRDQRQDGGGYR